MDLTPKTRHLEIELPDELADSIQEAIACGDYHDNNDVIRDALYAWFASRSPLLQNADRLRALWEEGLASGSGRTSSAADIIAEARRRKAGLSRLG